MAHPRSLCENATVPEDAMPHDVFLSYASTDRAAADAVCAALEARGIRCWMAPRDVPAGADWGEAILTAIGRAHAMVLVLSRHTAASVHVRNEVVTAVSQSLALVPVRIEDCQPGGALRLHLAGSHWLNVYPLPVEQHADALAGGVRLALAADATIEIPRAQAAAMVAAARASAAAAADRPVAAREAARPERSARPTQARPAAAPVPVRPGAQAASANGAPAPHLPTPRRGLGIAVAIGGLALLCAAVAAAWYYEPRLKALFGLSAAAPAEAMAAPAVPVAAAAIGGDQQPPTAATDPPRGLAGAARPLPGLGPTPLPVGPGGALPPAPAGLSGPPAQPLMITPQPASPPRSMTQAPPPRTPPPPAPAARVMNGAAATISRIFVARVEDGIGREDWLGQAQITPGNAVLLRPPAGQGCLFNIRVVYVGGRTEDRPGVDLCAAPDLRFEGSKGAG
jgi:hypothetical protein